MNGKLLSPHPPPGPASGDQLHRPGPHGGLNAQVHTVPHHASRAQYGEATALEALLGWLYLRGELERIEALFQEMMKEEEAHGD